MKKTLLISCVLLMGINAFAQIPPYVPTNGLVGWWPFTGNASDSSGNAHDGTVFGATLISDRLGNVNSAFSFNGSSYISVPHHVDFDFGIGDYSISAWAVRDGSNQWQEIISKTLPGPDFTGYQLRFGSSNIDFISGSTYNGSWFDNGIVTSPISNGNWYHFVGVFSPSTGTVSLYVNGALVGTVASTVPLINPDNTNDLMFGVYQPIIVVPSGPEFLTGKIDDIGIWNRALTSQEVTDLFQSGVAPASCLVAYYPFTGNASDSSGYGNNGTVNGATLTQDRFGNANSAYYFTDNNNEYIDVPQSVSLNNCSQITISLWTKLASWSQYNSFINKSDQNGNNSWALTNVNTPGDSLIFYFGNWPNWFSSPIVPGLNQWHQLAITYSFNGATGKCYFYIDGLATDSFATTTYLPITNYDMRIGSYANTGYNTVDGSIDDVRIYSCALPASDILDIYNGTVALHEPIGNSSFSLAPNPTTSTFTVKNLSSNKTSLLQIVNPIGKIIYTAKLFGKKEYKVDANFARGIYFVSIYDGEGTIVKKLIVE